MRPKIVESRLKNKLGKIKYRIYGRKCIIAPISANEKGRFLDKYHMQGNDKANIYLGAFYKNRLVAVMTFCKSRFNSNYQWELSRFCSLFNFRVVGIYGKLFRYFERRNAPKSCISYCDRRWSAGNVYTAMGFKMSHVSPPNYFYVDKKQRLSRYNYEKHKLSKILPKFDESLSEWENMQNNGYDRIWDCGNFVFTKTYI